MATPLDNIALPDNQLSGATATTNAQKFLDLWWRICSKTGLGLLIAAIADGILTRTFPKLGPDWKPTTVTTSVQQEVAALPQNVKNIRDDIAALQKQVAALSTPTVTLTDAQVGALALQIASALPAAPSADTVAAAVMAAIKAQAAK